MLSTFEERISNLSNFSSTLLLKDFWVVIKSLSKVSHLFIGETDTITDLADGFLGAAIGGALLAVWALARYTSRRLPTRLARDVLRTPSAERRPRTTA